MVDRSDVQGLVYSGYREWPASCVVLIRFEAGRPGAWLRRILPWISSGARRTRHEGIQLNLAFTCRGLTRLGLPQHTLSEFSREFRQGMAHPERSRLLADEAEDSPEHWEFGGSETTALDALLLVYARNPTELEVRLESLALEFERFGIEAEEQLTYLPADGREHFGFRMSVSQPRFKGDGRPDARPRVPVGEFLLGHENALGELTPAPSAPFRRSTRELPPLTGLSRTLNWGLNGSFLVLRKFEQNVPAFRGFLERAANGAEQRERLAAQMVGRWCNGAPLALYPDAPPTHHERDTAFDYAEVDPQGLGCPFGAHVRRAHPRSDSRETLRVAAHRLLRRGRLYGPASLKASPTAARGLLFLALNADIGQQFELLSGHYLGGQPRAELRGEADPLLGHARVSDAGAPTRDFSVPGQPVRRVWSGLPRFVRLRGGAYCFMPSLRALNYLADLRADGE